MMYYYNGPEYRALRAGSAGDALMGAYNRLGTGAKVLRFAEPIVMVTVAGAYMLEGDTWNAGKTMVQLGGGTIGGTAIGAGAGYIGGWVAGPVGAVVGGIAGGIYGGIMGDEYMEEWYTENFPQEVLLPSGPAPRGYSYQP